MAPAGRRSVASGKHAVRPEAVLVVATSPLCTPRYLETERRRYAAESLRRQRTAKPQQHISLVAVEPRRGIPYKRADRRLRRRMYHGIKCSSNRLDPAAQPTDRAGQGDVRPAQRIGSSLDAFGRRRHGDTVFDRNKQAWQPGG